LYKYCSEFN